MSNSLAKRESDVLHETQKLRHQLLDMITDADLTYTFPNSPSLGALIRAQAETEHTYAESFTTFKQAFDYRHSDDTIETSVERLRTWFTQIEIDLDAALNTLTEGDIETKTVDRYGWFPKLGIQLHTYRESILIFAAKASIYVRALGKNPADMPEQFRYWIG